MASSERWTEGAVGLENIAILFRDALNSRVAMKPFLKWAGGKRWLVRSGQLRLPTIAGRYIEPFLGGGAVFFATRPKNALLSDNNERLIELYQVLRDHTQDLQRLIEEHAAAHCREYYYRMRSRKFDNCVARAAQFMYLNRTCWNGLYRENKNGKFNVPIGTKQSVIMEDDDFRSWSSALANTTIRSQDFEKSIETAKEGDFVFVDPPYAVPRGSREFIKYSRDVFSWEDQRRLRRALGSAAKKGAGVAMTNANHEAIRELYRGFGKQVLVSRHSVIAGKAVYRARYSELLVTAWGN